jgi:hypothetical protein
MTEYIKHILILGTQVSHAKVSHGPFVGLPSVTGMTGLARAFTLELERELQLSPGTLQPEGVCMALENYHRHEGYKKTIKPGTAEARAVAALHASFTAHFIFRIGAITPAGEAALISSDLLSKAPEILGRLRLCGGTLQPPKRAVNLDSPGLRKKSESELERALMMIPSHALILRDQSEVIEAARAEGLPLMELLVSTSMRPEHRPAAYRDFFERQGYSVERLVPLAAGFHALEEDPSLSADKQDVFGEFPDARAASMSYTLGRLQTAASVRLTGRENGDYLSFWKEWKEGADYVCLPAL